jgi:O-antigen/teichoic acid export membrane protein
MGLVVRQSILTTIIAYAGVVIGYFNLLYLYPRFLEPTQVGLLRAIQDAAILFAPFAQFGLAYGILRYQPQMARTKGAVQGFITLMLLLSLVGFGIFLAVFKFFETEALSFFEENAAEFIQYATTVLWLTFILLFTAVLETYARSLLKTIFPYFVKEILIRLLMALSVTAYFMGWVTFDGFILMTVLSNVGCLVALIIYLIAGGDLALSGSFTQFDRTLLRAMIRYSLFSFAGAAGIIIIGKLDGLMVTGLAGPAAMAVYSTAFYMATVIEVPKKALTSVAMPLISRAFDKNDMGEIAALYRKTAINQMIIGALLLIGVFINLDSIYALMPRREIYEAGHWVVIIVGIGKLVDMAFGPSSEIIVLSKYYGFNIVLIIILAAMSIALNFALIPLHGINGAAISIAASLIVFNLVKYVFIAVKLKMQPFGWPALIVLLIAAVTLCVNYVIPRLDLVLLDIIVRSAIVTIVFGGATWITKISPDGNNLVKKFLTRIRFLSK